MPRYNYNIPTSALAPRYRQFRGNWWDRTKLAISGSNSDGSSNTFGKVVNTVLPPVLGAISTYYTGSYALGDKVGNLAVTGLDSWTNKQLRGTGAADVAKQERAREEKIRGTISLVGNTAAGLYSSFGGKTNQSKNSSTGQTAQQSSGVPARISTPNNMRGMSGSIDNGGRAGTNINWGGVASSLDSLLGDLGNRPMPQDINPNALDPNSALAKFYAGGDQQIAGTLNGLINNYGNEQYSAGNILEKGLTGSTTGMFGEDVRMLDNKNKIPTTFGSSLPFDGFGNPNSFFDGGKMLPLLNNFQTNTTVKSERTSRYAVPGIKKKTLLS